MFEDKRMSSYIFCRIVYVAADVDLLRFFDLQEPVFSHVCLIDCRTTNVSSSLSRISVAVTVELVQFVQYSGRPILRMKNLCV